MGVNEELRKLICRIKGCLKCYVKFKDYSEEDRIKIREWYNECPWFFPPSEDMGVKGFFGTGDVMFVCERPSTRGSIPSSADLRFYELIKKYGFENAHITDLVKCRGTAGKIGGRQIDNCLPFLKEEIRILKPRLMIAVGGKVYKVLTDKRTHCFAPVEKILHYSYRYSQPDKLKEKLDEEFRRISEIYRKLKK